MIQGPALFVTGQTSAETENSRQREGSDRIATIWILDVTDEGSWSGALQIAARALGAGKDGATSYSGYIGAIDREDGSTIDGDTGITAEGVYEVNIAGLEVRLEHTRNAGAVRVREHIAFG